MFFGTSRFTVALLLSASIACLGGDRVDPKLRAVSASQTRVRVLIVLSQQPQHDIVSRVEESRRGGIAAARSRLDEAVRTPFSLDRTVSEARTRLDQAILDARRTAIDEIQRVIGPQQENLATLLRLWGATGVHTHSVVNVITAEVPSALLPLLDASPDVAAVYPAERTYPLLSTSVPAIRAPTFWSAHSRGNGESVGILDSGVMGSNPGFSGVPFSSGVFLSEGSADPCFADDTTATDHLGHGTHVAGIVASQGGGSCSACVGVAPGIDLYSLKIGWVVKSGAGCPGGGAADDGDVVDAVDWAVANTSVNVFNFSYGGPPTGDDDGMSQLFDQIEDAWGVNIVIAAGNSGGGGVQSPGVSYNGVTVASVDDQGTVDRSDDSISSFSSRGPTSSGRFKPDVSAPGNHGSPGGILSTYINGDYARLAGTSMATPHAAGALALLRAAGAQDGLAAKSILINTAYNTKSGWQQDIGWGFIDLGVASAQVNNHFRNSLSSSNPAFFAGPVNGTLKATLVWNRHLSGSGSLTQHFSNLDLYLYDGAAGGTLGSSTSSIQNVEQVVASGVGNAVLKVVPVNIDNSGSAEPYALAVSASGFSAKNGPSLSPSCTGPSAAVAPGATFTVSCGVTNSGDLTAFSVGGSLNWQGSGTGTTLQFGNVGPGQQASAQSWQMTAPSSTGSYTLVANDSSSSYGQTFTGTGTVSVVVGQTYSLTTSVSPASAGVVFVSPSPSAGGFVTGSRVCLSATANAGYVFSSWSGAPLDAGNCLVMSANTSVTAVFVKSTVTLSLSVSPSGSGTLTPSPAPTGGTYPSGTKVCLTETPTSGYVFSSWSGATLDASNCLVLSANTSITAVFARANVTLTLSISPSGAGTLTPSPAPTGGTYTSGTKVCLTETPTSGYLFSSWSGAALDASHCLVLNASAAVTANFINARDTLTVSVSPSGAGTVTTSPAASGGSYPTGTKVCLTARAKTGYVFLSWSGATLDSGNCLVLSANTSLTANFAKPYILTLTSSPTSGGTVSASPTAVGGAYLPGTKVCLTAKPSSGYVFTGWTGAKLDASNCLIMSAAARVGATFARAYTLTVTVKPAGSGTVTANPPSASHSYALSTKVCLTATPNSGYVFSTWSGTALDSNKCLVIKAAASVTATFKVQ